MVSDSTLRTHFNTAYSADLWVLCVNLNLSTFNAEIRRERRDTQRYAEYAENAEVNSDLPEGTRVLIVGVATRFEATLAGISQRLRRTKTVL